MHYVDVLYFPQLADGLPGRPLMPDEKRKHTHSFRMLDDEYEFLVKGGAKLTDSLRRLIRAAMEEEEKNAMQKTDEAIDAMQKTVVESPSDTPTHE